MSFGKKPAQQPAAAAAPPPPPAPPAPAKATAAARQVLLSKLPRAGRRGTILTRGYPDLSDGRKTVLGSAISR